MSLDKIPALTEPVERFRIDFQDGSSVTARLSTEHASSLLTLLEFLDVPLTHGTTFIVPEVGEDYDFEALDGGYITATVSKVRETEDFYIIFGEGAGGVKCINSVRKD